MRVLLVRVRRLAGYQHHLRLNVRTFPFLDLRVKYMGALGVKVFFVISGLVEYARLLKFRRRRYG